LEFTDLTGKVALVTGATAGIGEAVARGFASAGSHVALCGRRDSEGEAVAADIRRQGGEAAFFHCDVAEAPQVRDLVGETVERFGRLDIAVNNAGIGSAGGKLADIDEADFDTLLGINLKGVWLCMKYEITEFLRRQTGGSIVNMGSVLGSITLPGSGQYSSAHYVAAKHGIEGLTKAAAVDYGRDGIRVNTLAPGVIVTAISQALVTEEAPLMRHWREQTPLGRLGEVSDVVAATLFLASDSARYISGTTLVVDGGYLAQ
jgi:NAD(P)-dependent dehydrogenase (short-subunit alcohol dehydrogenase family)